MSDLSAIISFVSWGSKLALDLYKFAATAPLVTIDINDIARNVSNFSLIIKHIATLIKEDDDYPSSEARETIQDVLDQCKAVYTEVESIVPPKPLHLEDEAEVSNVRYESWEPSSVAKARLEYLAAHLDSLKSTLSVMLQALNTVQIILWARTRAAISPHGATKAVSNEKDQLESLIIEQQISLLSVWRIHENRCQSQNAVDPELLMEGGSSQNLTITEEEKALTPAGLCKFKDPALMGLDSSSTDVERSLVICRISKARMDYVLERWTRLHELESRVEDFESQTGTQRKANQQQTVEYDESDYKLSSSPMSPTSPIVVPGFDRGPFSPASSCGVSPKSPGQPLPSGYSPQSPTASISTLPMAAAAVANAKNEDEDVQLGIPWRLCSRQYHWDFIDGKVQHSNTDIPPSDALTDRHSWTEIMASWLDKQAIKEAGYNYSQVQKDWRERGRTRFETCFVIQQPLVFSEVQRLVERTVELFRKTRSLTPPSSKAKRRSSSSKHTLYPPQLVSEDRNRTSLANQPPRLDRSATSYPFPHQPQYTDHAKSFPHSPQSFPPTLSHLSNLTPNATTNLHLPNQPGPYCPQTTPYSPQAHPIQTRPYSPHISPTPAFSQRSTHPSGLPQALGPYLPLPVSQPHFSAATLCDSTSDSGDTSEPRHRRSSKSSSSNRSKHRDSSYQRRRRSTVGTLAKVGGLAALLDGIVDLGVL
ncbi:hypothetical protein GQ43DRAFT_476342 [Delitschia confertaspora ATCC 74209]|uniref:Fungal N-terminal domain-containing protein n=1 Tax=Delitschia confertaspora ATCC 74209 TaxID=1513339 RepID=A0A9P4JEL2_9PLEO|nr:hypothetical protein GQ43DRAFT_476342 [Delitschia confertaspora ATCC 74209]